jgi:hypothetical protein
MKSRKVVVEVPRSCGLHCPLTWKCEERFGINYMCEFREFPVTRPYNKPTRACRNAETVITDYNIKHMTWGDNWF